MIDVKFLTLMPLWKHRACDIPCCLGTKSFPSEIAVIFNKVCESDKRV